MRFYVRAPGRAKSQKEDRNEIRWLLDCPVLTQHDRHMKFDKEVDLAEEQETVHRLIVVAPEESLFFLKYNIAQENKIVKNIKRKTERKSKWLKRIR